METIIRRKSDPFRGSSGYILILDNEKCLGIIKYSFIEILYSILVFNGNERNMKNIEIGWIGINIDFFGFGWCEFIRLKLKYIVFGVKRNVSIFLI